ncbi:MAG: arginine--tRNA ligase [Bacteroidetes bacterium]|nr:arginine--tRNA ligase [Bacteroidota bacterium]
MIEKLLEIKIIEAVRALYSTEILPTQVQLQKTRKDFDGDYTIVVFPFTKSSRKSPETTANDIGTYLVEHMEQVSAFNVIKGFLNLVISGSYWNGFYARNFSNNKFGFVPQMDSNPFVVEYSSPNTNKPLHLGHIRNNLLGFSVARILEANGHKVIRVNLVNDRGIHICKSMLAWKRWGDGETPSSSGIKGDHLVGKYYVIFDQQYKKEIEKLISLGISKDEAAKSAPLILEAQEMLRKWEANDDEIISLWKLMNGWVYEGFEQTYQTMGISFDKTYYESKTYLLGKSLVDEGLQAGALHRRADGSVWIDLSSDGLDEKLLLRSDGTSVYMTQDLGTAQQRYNEFTPEKLVYVVGNEQEYHFQVLAKVFKHMGKPWYDSIFHLSYGMVELPEGKMKSREGTVVDADDLMEEMFRTAEITTRELGKVDDFSSEEAVQLFRIIGLGALKYFILKVDPKKNMLFNPTESIDFNGNTGPFIQYTYARIQSVLRNAVQKDFLPNEIGALQIDNVELLPQEKEVLRILHQFPGIVNEAGDSLSPALIANYIYELACEFNRFYHDITILKETDLVRRNFRLGLCTFTGNVIKNAMWLLGIDVPQRM